MEIVEKYEKNLGKLLQSLLALEFYLRCFILKKEKEESSAPNLMELKEGCAVKENAFTDYKNLGEIIDKVNNYTDIFWKIDKKRVLKIRDALAHGRILCKTPGEDMRIFKFSKPQNGFVTVEVALEMTPEWFNKSINFLFLECKKVKETCESFE